MERAVKKLRLIIWLCVKVPRLDEVEGMEKHHQYRKGRSGFHISIIFWIPQRQPILFHLVLLTGPFLCFASTCEPETRLLPLLANRKIHGKRQVTLGRNTGCKDKKSYAI